MSEQPDFDSDTGDVDTEVSVATDEDRMGADPLEDGMDTAEDYSREVKLGGAISDDEDSLAYRIPQEEPDPALQEIDAEPGRPLAATPIDELDEHIDDPENSVDGPIEDELLTSGDGEVDLGVSSADGAVEPTGLPTDDRVGEVAGLDDEGGAEGAEQQALRVEQES